MSAFQDRLGCPCRVAVGSPGRVTERDCGSSGPTCQAVRYLPSSLLPCIMRFCGRSASVFVVSDLYLCSFKKAHQSCWKKVLSTSFQAVWSYGKISHIYTHLYIYKSFIYIYTYTHTSPYSSYMCTYIHHIVHI